MSPIVMAIISLATNLPNDLAALGAYINSIRQSLDGETQAQLDAELSAAGIQFDTDVAQLNKDAST